jgi:hypothetical protein
MRDLRGHIVIEQELHRISSLICSATFWLSGLSAGSSHNWLYEPCPFHARKGMLQRFIFAVFSNGPPATNREDHEGRRTRALPPSFSGLAASSWGRLSENIPLEPPRKRKGEVFTLEAPLLLQSAAKDERAEPRRAGSACATSTASCPRPLEPDTGIFPGEPSGIHASPPSVLAGICAGSKVCNKGPERSCIELIGSEKTRRWSNLRRRSYRFSAKGGNCL